MVNLDFNEENDELIVQDEEESSGGVVKEEKEKKRVATFMIVCVALLLLLLSIGGWVVYDKFKTRDDWNMLQVQFDSSRNLLREEYNKVLQKMDSLNSSNMDLQHELTTKRKEIDKLNSDLDRIVREKDSDLNEARAKIQELSSRIKELMEEVESLKAANRELMASGGQMQIVSGDTILVSTRPMKLVGGEAVPLANPNANNGRLQAIDVNIVPVVNGEEKVGGLSKYTSSLKVTFTLAKDSLIASGNRELQVVLSGPNTASGVGNATVNGKESKEEANSISMQSAGVQKVYTIKLVQYYDKFKGTPVAHIWDQKTRFGSGEYKAEVFYLGNKIGEGRQYLKRGTKAFPF
ncbi:hypothetical protein SAMN05421788_103354 [Filimonas lacunae]|uniref:Uncharacterized protein n=1 Tax=Filimonas lacunae TaxID=477680 RepID=A0A173MK42_9BACT|nr:hypothetical protein [Filimonas lacunae]BAV08015.1 hypothetical protein FLA_4048 [Filimonas lacunae]SIT07973.1 hypothetical protein SAMN05421788_103354 [Filimonas lacunae]